MINSIQQKNASSAPEKAGEAEAANEAEASPSHTQHAICGAAEGRGLICRPAFLITSPSRRVSWLQGSHCSKPAQNTNGEGWHRAGMAKEHAVPLRSEQWGDKDLSMLN